MKILKKESENITLKIPAELKPFYLELFQKLGLEIQPEKKKKEFSTSFANADQISYITKRLKKKGKSSTQNLQDLLQHITEINGF